MPDTTTTTTTEPSYMTATAAAQRAGIGGVIEYHSRYQPSSPLRFTVRSIHADEGRVAVTTVGGGVDDNVYDDATAATPRWAMFADADTTAAIARAVAATQPRSQLSGQILPRTVDEARRMADAINTLGTWLHGGARQIKGEDVARNHPDGELCGAYEALVCPVFGWEPRRAGSMTRATATFYEELSSWEAQNTGLSALELLERRAELFSRGGLFNQATVDHIDSHLESHKIPAVNAVLDEIGWDGAESERDYEVCVRVERTVTQYAYVTLNRTAASADDAANMIDRYDVSEASDYADWEDDDVDVTDYDVHEVIES